MEAYNIIIDILEVIGKLILISVFTVAIFIIRNNVHDWHIKRKEIRRNKRGKEQFIKKGCINSRGCDAKTLSLEQMARIRCRIVKPDIKKHDAELTKYTLDEIH